MTIYIMIIDCKNGAIFVIVYVQGRSHN